MSWRPETGFEITLRPGAAPDDLADRLRLIPPTMLFTEAFGDLDLVLVFRGEPGASAPAGGLTPPRPPARRRAARRKDTAHRPAGRPARRPAVTSRHRPRGGRHRPVRRDDMP
jgi:uncharacterized repeat protein (TIGR03917 family)